MNFFKRENPKTELEGLDKAQKILDERFEKKQITIEQYQKQCIEFGKRREKYEKMLIKQNK